MFGKILVSVHKMICVCTLSLILRPSAIMGPTKLCEVHKKAIFTLRLCYSGQISHTVLYFSFSSSIIQIVWAYESNYLSSIFWLWEALSSLPSIGEINFCTFVSFLFHICIRLCRTTDYLFCKCFHGNPVTHIRTNIVLN